MNAMLCTLTLAGLVILEMPQATSAANSIAYVEAIQALSAADPSPPPPPPKRVRGMKATGNAITPPIER